jgi:hypothetical protein
MHQAAIRAMEVPRTAKDGDFMAFSGGSRRFLRYSYGDLLTEDRSYGVLYRIWPGTQRLLLWADPAMASGYGRYAGFCGCDGMELMEPLTFKGRMGSGISGGRTGYADTDIAQAASGWEKYELTYRVIGRLLYDPDGDPEGWRRHLRHNYGSAASDLEGALSSAGRILPLVTMAHHPSASNNRFWPEVYTNQPIVDPDRSHPYRDTPEPRCFNTVSPLDPAMFASITEFVDRSLQEEPDGRISPLEVADYLEMFSATASEALTRAREKAPDPSKPRFRAIEADVAIQAGLGRFFADKLRAGVSFQYWKETGDAVELSRAVTAYRIARDAWKDLASVGSVYQSDLTFGRAPHIEDDIQDMERLLDRHAERPGPASAGNLCSTP